MAKYTFENYSVEINNNSFGFFANGIEIFNFDARTQVNLPDKEDIDEKILGIDEKYENGELTAIWITQSTIWKKKEYILKCCQNCARYFVRVYGEGNVGKVKFFNSPHQRNGYEAMGYFTPVTPWGGSENRNFTVTESFVIKPGYMSPPPLCYSFCTEGEQTRVGVALAAEPGGYNFDSFAYSYSSKKWDFCFETDYFGYQRANGIFETAQILLFTAQSDIGVLEKYRDLCYDFSFAKRRTGAKASWWLGPLFCGWGEQCWLSNECTDVANRREYEIMLNKLKEKNINPTAIIIDDKWQKLYGEALPDEEKWPNMREFVDKLHSDGKRVLLWFRTWNSEGLFDDEQVHSLCLPVGADPTNPKYVKRMRETIHRLLSADEGCYNCDGFKIDFADCMPLGPNLSTYESGVYGIELLKRMFELIYSSAKAAKPDALINTSCCNPYFASVTDQARLHDYSLGSRDAVTNLDNRSAIYKAVMDDASIDTDAPNWRTNRDTMRYLKHAAEVGVPDLYAVSRPIMTDRDWQELSLIYEKYSKNIKNEF